VVVRSADLVALLVGELKLDVLVRPALLVEQGGRYAPESMARHASSVAHAVQSAQDGVVAHRLLMVALSGEEQGAVTSQGVQASQEGHGLGGEGHHVRRLHLHA